MATHPTGSGIDRQAGVQSPEHVPARPEVVVAYLQQNIENTARQLPGNAVRTAEILGELAGELPDRLSVLDENIEKTGQQLARVGVFKNTRGTAVSAVDRASSNSTRIILKLGDGQTIEATGPTLRDFSTDVRIAFADKLSAEPKPSSIKRSYDEVRARVLAQVKTDLNAVFDEGEQAFAGKLGAAKRQLLQEAVSEYFGRAMSSLDTIRRTLGVRNDVGAVAVNGKAEPASKDIRAAVTIAVGLQDDFLGKEHLAKLVGGRSFFESLGLIPDKEVAEQIRQIIESYPRRLDVELGRVIQKWLPAERPKAAALPKRTAAPVDRSFGSQAETMVTTARAQLESRGLGGSALVAALRRQVEHRLSPQIVDRATYEQALAAIDRVAKQLKVR